MSLFELSEDRATRSLVARFREDWRYRATGAIIALALELLLLWALIALGEWSEPRKEVPLATVTFDARDESEQPAPKPEQKAATQPRAMTQPQTPPSPEPVPVPTPPPAATIPVLPQQAQSFDLSKIGKKPPGPPVGPAFTPTFGDSQRVGTAPNGQPMYAARWYREPTDQELRGYLSTAQGPGWGLITCKTVPDFRVEDCVGLDEYPEGSHMLRAVLAAAWQFRVRPPQVGGVSQVGDWVRIRIEYTEKPVSPYGNRDGN